MHNENIIKQTCHTLFSIIIDCFYSFFQTLNTILCIVKLFVGTVNCEMLFIDPSTQIEQSLSLSSKRTILHHFIWDSLSLVLTVC